jgi:hypothetical protein
VRRVKIKRGLQFLRNKNPNNFARMGFYGVPLPVAMNGNGSYYKKWFLFFEAIPPSSKYAIRTNRLRRSGFVPEQALESTAT